MAYIIKSLNVHYHTHEIIKQFKEMIHHDIEKAKTLTPRLKLYFRMAKMEIQKVNPSDAHKLKEKCKDLTPIQRQKAV